MSRQAWGKGRALLEALGLTGAQIAQCYGMHPLNEEESVQDGLQVWIEGGCNTTWGDLLRAMETAGIAIQQRDGLKEELCSNTGESTRADIVPHMRVCVRVFVWVDVNVCIYACVGVCVQKFLWLCRISNIVMHV